MPAGVRSQQGNPQLFILAVREGQQLLLCCGGGAVAMEKGVQLKAAVLRPSVVER